MDWHRRRRLTTALFIGGLALLAALVAISFGFGLYALRLNDRLAALHRADESGQAIMGTLIDAESGVRGFIITADPSYLAPYYSGIERTKELTRDLLRNPVVPQVTSAEGRDLAELVTARLEILAERVATVRRDGADAADQTPRAGSGKALTDEIRATLEQLNEDLDDESDRITQRLGDTVGSLSQLMVGCVLFAIGLSVVQFFLFRQEIRNRGAVEANLGTQNRQISLISQLADSLQSSGSREESYQIIEAFARDMLPETAGALYVYSNSRDNLGRAATWGSVPGRQDAVEHFAPDECWGLRRGKLHLSSTLKGHLQCTHVDQDPPRSYMCLPITARGLTSGLLHLESPDPDDEHAFETVRAFAGNFADQLSLALVNIELRERLQNMAIRDPLTELYNRRFLDEALARELLRTRRSNGKLCVLMIDIDHFKRVNDSYGHQAGDEILRQVAQHLVATFRRSDLVCRYGGEELLVVLPECGLDEAIPKAEAARNGVSLLPLRASGIELPSVTVSIGVACFPDHARDGVDLISHADQALYVAKRTGRNRVVAAEPATRQAEPSRQTPAGSIPPDKPHLTLLHHPQKEP